MEQLSIISSAGPQDSDIAYELSHPDTESLESAVRELADALAQIDGVSEIEDGLDIGKRQFNFTLTPAGEAAGLTPRDVARQVRQAFFGEEVQRIQRGSDELRVFVRYPENERLGLSDLTDLRIAPQTGAACRSASPPASPKAGAIPGSSASTDAGSLKSRRMWTKRA
ncbi:MAG: efflux RND transporter permease subunit [Oceanicaulis sp.]|nr:efflux RND transporter permease subunit [Oceanicaulis sp.]